MLDGGAAVLRTAADLHELETGWQILARLHQRRLESLGQSGCFHSPAFSQFHRAAAEAMHQAGRLRLHWLELAGRPIAAEFHLLGDDVVFAYQGGIEPNALKREPGRLITLATLERTIAGGYQAFDFCRGDEPYKAHWRARRASRSSGELSATARRLGCGIACGARRSPAIGSNAICTRFAASWAERQRGTWGQGDIGKQTPQVAPPASSSFPVPISDFPVPNFPAPSVSRKASVYGAVEHVDVGLAMRKIMPTINIATTPKPRHRPPWSAWPVRPGLRPDIAPTTRPAFRSCGRYARPLPWRRETAWETHRPWSLLRTTLARSGWSARSDRSGWYSAELWVLRSDKASARRRSMPDSNVTLSDQQSRDMAKVSSAVPILGMRMIASCSCRVHSSPRRMARYTKKPAAAIQPKNIR